MSELGILLLAAGAPIGAWVLHVHLLYRRLAGTRTDPMTGLLTRAGWTARAERLIRRHHATVALLDLDRFKPVNDRYGHAAGDAVLRAVGARITEWCGSTAVAGRLGGDEFVVVLTDPPALVPARLESLRQALQQPVPWPGGPLVVGASMGSAPVKSRALGAALGVADKAMFQDKRGGRRGRARITAWLAGAR